MRAGIAALLAAVASWGQYPVKRLRPSAFKELPAAVANELTRRGCTIPQPYTGRRANAIRGEFARAGQIDWAVLCSGRGFSSILVFWSGAGEPATVHRWRETDESLAVYDAFIRPARAQVHHGPLPRVRRAEAAADRARRD